MEAVSAPALPCHALWKALKEEHPKVQKSTNSRWKVTEKPYGATKSWGHRGGPTAGTWSIQSHDQELTLARAVFSSSPLLQGTDTSDLPRKVVDEKARRLGVTGVSGLEEGWTERSGPECVPERLLNCVTVHGSRSFLGEGNMVQPLWEWSTISSTTTHRCAAHKSSSSYYMLPPNENLERKGSVSSWF